MNPTEEALAAWRLTASTASAPFAGRLAFQDALRTAFLAAAAEGAAEIWLVDADFSDWPLGQPAVIGSLTAWARSRRRLTLAACHFGEVARRHPRWVAWRRAWSHIVDCRSSDAFDPTRFPSLLLASRTIVVRRFESRDARGVASCDAAELARARETIDALLQRSIDAFPVTRLGL